MKRSVAIACLAIIALAPVLLVTDAWARAGGGSSGGSRGSRSYSSPARPAPTPATPSQPTSPPSSFQQPQPQRSGWGAGLMGGLAGFALGGLLGSMLFGHGMGGGIGMLEILLIAGGAFLLFRMMRSRQSTPEPSYSQGGGGGQWQGQPPPQPYQTPSYQAQPGQTVGSDLDPLYNGPHVPSQRKPDLSGSVHIAAIGSSAEHVCRTRSNTSAYTGHPREI